MQMRASWLYLLSGHGKGPCDSVVGTAKRLADDAVKQKKVTIQNARDFFDWGASQNQSQIKYVFAPKSLCEESQRKVAETRLHPIQGTMKLHAVIPLSNGSIAVRDTSCIYHQCYNDGT